MLAKILMAFINPKKSSLAMILKRQFFVIKVKKTPALKMLSENKSNFPIIIRSIVYRIVQLQTFSKIFFIHRNWTCLIICFRKSW